MPIHSVADALQHVPTSRLLSAVGGVIGCYTVKIWAGGRKCTWERDWAGKMVLIIAVPTPTILSLIHHLLHLPFPPQILFLPPLASPLPEELLTILHTIRLGIDNPLAQLHAEALPRSAAGVRDFIRKWGTVPQGTAGQDGRRVDAVVLGEGWEVASSSPIFSLGDGGGGGENGAGPSGTAKSKARAAEQPWTIHQHQFHFLTSLLPYLLRAPAERNIRIITLISPAWAASLPTLQGKEVRSGPLQDSARRGITSLLLFQHFQLILDKLAEAAYGHAKPVPDPSAPLPPLNGTNKAKTGPEGKEMERVKSNVMALSVVMPWSRDEVWRRLGGIDESWWRWFLWILLYPLVIIFTPSPAMSIQSILFSLCAPVRYGELTPETREKGVSGGDVIRNCQLFDLPPVLLDPTLAKVNYDALEKEVEKRVKEEQYTPNGGVSTDANSPPASHETGGVKRKGENVRGT